MSGSFRGIAHVHSRYSHDGKSTIEDYLHFARRAGLSFVLFAEHFNGFSARKLEQYVEECQSYSSEELLLVPGMEFEPTDCGGIHILGFGVRHYLPNSDLKSILHGIREGGGISVLAHPSRTSSHFPQEHIGALDGVEVWNAAYDSRYLPHYRNLLLYRQMKGVNGRLLALGGLDMHSVEQFRGVVIETDRRTSSSRNLLGILKSGAFEIKGKYLSLNSGKMPNGFVLGGMALGRLGINIADKLMNYRPSRTKKDG